MAVIGDGPVGLEAALYGRTLNYDVQVYEKGEVGDHLRQWGHVRLFSAFGINRSRLGMQSLEMMEDFDPPKDESLLGGAEYRRRYLLALAHLPTLKDRIHEHTQVVTV